MKLETVAEYEAAIAEIDTLLNRLNELSIAVEAYEDEHYPISDIAAIAVDQTSLNADD